MVKYAFCGKYTIVNRQVGERGEVVQVVIVAVCREREFGERRRKKIQRMIEIAAAENEDFEGRGEVVDSLLKKRTKMKRGEGFGEVINGLIERRAKLEGGKGRGKIGNWLIKNTLEFEFGEERGEIVHRLVKRFAI